MDEINVTLPNGQQIIGTAQPDGTVRVAAWPRPSGRPFMAGIMAMILEQDYPEAAAEARRQARRPDCPQCHAYMAWDDDQGNPSCPFCDHGAGD